MRAPQIRQQQSPLTRLIMSINMSLEPILVQAGKDFLRAKSDVDFTIAKVKATEALKDRVQKLKEVHGAQEVNEALKFIHFEEFDTD